MPPKTVWIDPEVRAATLAARWAQRIGLPAGNLWEPPMTRHILAEYQRIPNWAFIEAYFCLRLGLALEHDGPVMARRPEGRDCA